MLCLVLIGFSADTRHHDALTSRIIEQEWKYVCPRVCRCAVKTLLSHFIEDLTFIGICIQLCLLNADVCVIRESEDTALMLLKQVYAVMGVTAQKSGTDVASSQQHGVTPLHQAPQGSFRPPTLGPHLTNGSSSSDGGTVPVFAARTQVSGSAHLGYSPHPVPTAASSQSPAVGPPPKSGFVRK